jgi:hypothetical protein
VNDGDPQPPWDQLSDIRDPRLIRFGLKNNYGPFFATAVTLNATSAPYFLIQDADDWSAPTRAEQLLQALERDRSDLAVSAEPQFVETPAGQRVVGVRWSSASCDANAGDFVVHQRITSKYKYRAPHHGLFRSSSLRAIGGYYAGLRISYDTLLPNLILMIGRISHVRANLYYRLLRPHSLTHDKRTGIGSSRAKKELLVQRQLYRSCFSSYRLFAEGLLSAPQLTATIRRICGANVSLADRNALIVEANRLFRVL